MDKISEQISAPLKRKIEPGTKYTKLLPNVSCKPTNLGNGSNDTIEGVEFMAEWVKKYAWQTGPLVNQLLKEGKLSKNNLAIIARGIDQFLYRHIQYTADGALQDLRSPACAWKQREQGIDCKSYTIFAMCMLQNLGITAAIRQVKQPGFYPDQYTHVYVVVPQNQNAKSLENETYFVIDPTRHERNAEGIFLKNKDKIMSGLQYRGLNAASSNPSTQRLIENFNKFLQYLLNAGVPVSTVSAVKEEVLKYTSKGIDPHFRVSLKKGIIAVNGREFRFNVTAQGLKNAAEQEQSSDDSDWFDSVGDWLGDIDFSGWWSDLTNCWGSSTSPENAEHEVKVDMPFMLEKSGLKNAVNTTNLNKFSNYVHGYIESAIIDQNSGGKSSCYVEGNKVSENGARQFLQKVLELLQQQGATITQSGTAPGGFSINLPGRHAGKTFKMGTGTQWPFTYKTYSVSMPSNSGNPLEDIGSGSGGNNSGGGYTGGGNNSGGGYTGGGGQVINPGYQNGGGTTSGSSTTGKVLTVGAFALGSFLLLPKIQGMFKPTKNQK